jgi:hypothetical protein
VAEFLRENPAEKVNQNAGAEKREGHPELRRGKLRDVTHQTEEERRDRDREGEF